MGKKTYEETWGTKVGRDCISLNTALCRWLGKRLTFLSEHTKSYPLVGYTAEEWSATLKKHGETLTSYAENIYDLPDKETTALYKEAQRALMWVATELGIL